MPSDADDDAATDRGLLTPVAAGHDAIVSDAAILDALVTAEVALWRALDTARTGDRGATARDARARELGWTGPGGLCRDHGVPLDEIVAASAGGGNPVIPLVRSLRDRGFDEVHEGATSQDILDTALMITVARAREVVVSRLREVESGLAEFAAAGRDQVAAARTLTQHAVPTTLGLRAATWLRGIRRSRERLEGCILPAQAGGAGGTLAAWVESLGAEDATRVPALLAAELGLDAPDAPWHVTRWPVTELGDALAQVGDALGKLAADVATLSRTEIGELSEGAGGGSSAMPQKQNPVDSVLVRSAVLRMPPLAATLHLASALAVDERPDGAWHAEWPTLRELLRLALGASAHAASLVAGLAVDADAVARNLGLTNGLIVAERLASASGLDAPTIADIVRRVRRGEDLRTLLAESGVADADDLADPTSYTGLAGRLVDDALGERTPE